MAHDSFNTMPGSAAGTVAASRSIEGAAHPTAILAPGPWTRVIRHWFSVVARWYAVHRTRQRLAQLPPELLRDVGLDELQVQDELEKPFWR
ncbi:MAG: DUF1127 domain-containing protein [Pseudomonadota bacterium]